MWGAKAKRIKALEYDLAEESRITLWLRGERDEQHNIAQALAARCDSLAADLKAAQNDDPRCFDCRRGHHDHSESGTCRRPDCGCDQ